MSRSSPVVERAVPCRNPAPDKPWAMRKIMLSGTRRASRTKMGRRAPSFSKVSLAAYWQGPRSCRLAEQRHFTRNGSTNTGQHRGELHCGSKPTARVGGLVFSFWIVLTLVSSWPVCCSLLPWLSPSWSLSFSHFFNLQKFWDVLMSSLSLLNMLKPPSTISVKGQELKTIWMSFFFFFIILSSVISRSFLDSPHHGNFWLDTRHWELRVICCRLFLYSFKFLSFSWDTWHKNSWILPKLAVLSFVSQDQTSSFEGYCGPTPWGNVSIF